MKKISLTFFAVFLFMASLFSEEAPYGSWCSPISAEVVAKGTEKIMEMHCDGNFTYWSQLRPQNKGFATLLRRDPSGKIEEMTPPDFNVRTFVHEYGGGAFNVFDGVAYASNGVDGRVYVIASDKSIRPLTAEGKTRFAHFRMSPYGLVAVGETHLPDKTVENFLALIDLETGDFKKLASGFDFYAFPSVSPDGKKIAWVSWNHPEMPWTNTELWKGEFREHGELAKIEKVAGNSDEAILQPEWSKEGFLYFVSDREKGWWNIFRLNGSKIENVCALEAEIGLPHWIFDRPCYAFLGSNVLFTCNKEGVWDLGLVEVKKKTCRLLKRKAPMWRELRGVSDGVCLIESFPDRGDAIVKIKDDSALTLMTLVAASQSISPDYISQGEHIHFPSGSRTAYGFFYPPKNADYKAHAGEKPPLIVKSHGGPTAQAFGIYQMGLQFWTSRGFAVLDVNYGGSTGYGRSYRNLLNNAWGIVDVEDCINGALYLVEKGLVDPNKLIIHGGSAGGYTTLAALAFHDVFKAGGCYYGVADITVLAEDTHKFESRYMEQLVGPYPAAKQVWEERSPIHSVARFKSPLILFQGEDDKIVPKNQSTMIYEALKARNIPTELYIYPGEEHGFRKAEHIIHSLNAELQFYQKIFNIPPCKVRN